MTPQMETLGEVLKRHRLALGFTLEQVAKQIETVPGRVQKFEDDKDIPTPDEWNRYRTRHERKLRAFSYLYEATRQAARNNSRQPSTPPRHVAMGQLGKLEVPESIVEQFKSTRRVIEQMMPPGVELAPVSVPIGSEPDAVDLVELPVEAAIEPTVETFPAALKKARGARTMQKFADDAGIGSQSTISGYESGRSFPLQAAMAKLVACSPELAPWQQLARPPGNPEWSKGKAPRPPKKRPRADVGAALAIVVENSDQVAALPKATKHRHDSHYTKHRASDNHEDEDRPDSIETETERIAREHTAATIVHLRAKRSLIAAQEAADAAQRELESAKTYEAVARKRLAELTKSLAEVA